MFSAVFRVLDLFSRGNYLIFFMFRQLNDFSIICVIFHFVFFLLKFRVSGLSIVSLKFRVAEQ